MVLVSSKPILTTGKEALFRARLVMAPENEFCRALLLSNPAVVLKLKFLTMLYEIYPLKLTPLL
jgi:hypothetical protein